MFTLSLGEFLLSLAGVALVAFLSMWAGYTMGVDETTKKLGEDPHRVKAWDSTGDPNLPRMGDPEPLQHRRVKT